MEYMKKKRLYLPVFFDNFLDLLASQRPHKYTSILRATCNILAIRTAEKEYGEGEREGERQRQRERQTDRERERETERHTGGIEEERKRTSPRGHGYRQKRLFSVHTAQHTMYKYVHTCTWNSTVVEAC